MSGLDAAQARFVGTRLDVPEGVEAPEIRYEIVDLGEMPDDFSPGVYCGQRMAEPTPKGEAPPLASYLAVYQRRGSWFSYRETDGASYGSHAYDTRKEAVANLEQGVAGDVAFWMEKVGWLLAGDRAENRDRWGRHSQQVIRCGGYHYTIGREPSDADYAANNMYGCFGFGGAQIAWRLLATGEQVGGRNCWGQGTIPAEFRDLLPDNAVRVVSEQEKRSREAMAKWEADWAAKEKARAELRASLAPFSASGREHPLPDQVLVHVEDMDDDYDAAVGDVRTETRDLDAANVVTSKMQPYVIHDDSGEEWHRPVLDLDLDAKLLPSSTPGHFHLYIDSPMRWDTYVALLEALADAEILERGFVDASITRKHTAVRLPWVRKGEQSAEAPEIVELADGEVAS